MTDDINKRIEALEAEIAKLKEASKPAEPFVPAKPWTKYDVTQNFRMPPSCVEEMARVVPDIARGNPNKTTIGKVEVKEEKPKVKGSGWVDAAPIGPRSDTKYVDAIAKHFDQMDKLEQAAKIAAAIKAVKE
jgi:hypothetical protein